MKNIEGNVTAPKGFVASGVYCGLRKNAKPDLALIYSEKECVAAAVYTQNKVYGAPITVTKEHLKSGSLKAVICNSGNANTCAPGGIEAAKRTCAAVAKELNIDITDVAVASTGVIGQPLNVAAIENGVPELVKDLSREGGIKAAHAIMTTDLAEKEIAVEVEIDKKPVRLGAICKGSGMIKPNMATMLCFITTDAAITTDMLKKALKNCVDDTFNCVSVDGDTSTNDMVLIMANGMAGNKEIQNRSQAYKKFVEALKYICTYLAKCMAKDGEGATKLITCEVINAKSKKDADALAKSVIMSNLVKAAMFGKDANWGRVLCAMGYSGVDFDPNKVDVTLTSAYGSVKVCENGNGLAFDEALALKVLDGDEVTITADLKSGICEGLAWGCDLTYDYVKINASYRT